MDVPYNDDMPGEGQPPWATKKGVQLVFRGVYKGSIDNAARRASA